MAKSGEPLSASRILVALDASQYGQAALEAAANLAAELRVELQAIFVEDINLVRLAALPFSREIDYPSAAARPLDPVALESALRVKADNARRAMEAIAGQLRIRCSFQVARGELVHSMLEAATGEDLLILAKENRIPLPPDEVRKLSTQTDPILAAYDGSPAAARALTAAARLARRLSAELIVLVVASSAASAQPLRASILQWLDRRHVSASIHRSDIRDLSALVDAASDAHAGLLVVNRDSQLLDETTIGPLVDELEHPVILVS